MDVKKTKISKPVILPLDWINPDILNDLKKISSVYGLKAS